MLSIAGSRLRAKMVATHLRSIAIIASLCGVVQGEIVSMYVCSCIDDGFCRISHDDVSAAHNERAFSIDSRHRQLR